MSKEEERALVKAHSVLIQSGADVLSFGKSAGDPVGESHDVSDEEFFSQVTIIEPPYDPIKLYKVHRISGSLRQNVDAYATNIDGFGFRLEMTVDVEGQDWQKKYAQAIYLERRNDAKYTGVAPRMPTDEEVLTRRSEVDQEIHAQYAVAQQFFDSCTDDVSFVDLRKRLRHDLEITGNAYMEVLRDEAGDVAEFTHIPAHTMRLCPLIKERVRVQVPFRVSKLSIGTKEKTKRFRTFVQRVAIHTVYFKEYGDPRVISSMSGHAYPSTADIPDNDVPATEIIHLKIHASETPYGIPRWIGTMVPQIGAARADRVNESYFDNKTVPPLALLVSGGHVTDDVVDSIKRHIQTATKGMENFHSMLIIEAEPSAAFVSNPSARTRIELKPLTDAQQKDALFLEYDKHTQHRVGMSFRLPKLLRGDVEELTRPGAETSLAFAEQQVFGGERQVFDHMINQKILMSMGVSYWRFVSNAPTLRDPEKLGQVIKDLTNASVLTPGESRTLAEGVFNKELPYIDDDWTKQPIAFSLAGLKTREHDTPVNIDADVVGEEQAEQVSNEDTTSDTAQSKEEQNEP